MSCVKVWNDPNIYGDSLLVPLRASCRALNRIFTKKFASSGLGKLFELISRIVALAILLTLLVISLPFALIGASIKFPCSLCTPQIPPALPGPNNPTSSSFFTPPPSTGEVALENDFFDLDGPFVTLAHLCTTADQMDYAIYVCTYVLSLVRHPDEDALVRDLLINFPFDKLPTDKEADIDHTLVDVCIRAVEVITGKNFNKEPKEVFEELAVRFDTYFHGTTITALDSIKVTGLSRSQRCGNDHEEIAKVIPGIESLFGWYTGQPKHSFYVAEGVSTAWLFAKRSPEWFAGIFEQAIGGHYRDGAYFADIRNKVKAMKDLETYLKKNGSTVAKIQEVKKFCEHFWQLYNGIYGAVVLARRNRPRSEAIADWLSVHSTLVTPEQYRQRLYTRMHGKTKDNSHGIKITNYDFAPKDLTLFRLPFHKMGADGRVTILSQVLD